MPFDRSKKGKLGQSVVIIAKRDGESPASARGFCPKRKRPLVSPLFGIPKEAEEERLNFKEFRGLNF